MEELIIDVELKSKSFEKYIKARADVDRPGWFKCSNQLLDDREFHDFTAAEICAWFYIMAESSILKSPKVRIIMDRVDSHRRKFSRDDLKSAISKLKGLGILLTDVASDVTSTLRPRSADVTLGEDRIGEEGIRVVVAPPAIASQKNGIIGPVLAELGGNSKREQALSTVPLDLQQEWLEMYDLQWLRNAILKAVSNYANKDPVDSIGNWEAKFVHWFSIEKKPKLKFKAAVEEKQPVISKAHSLTPIGDIFERHPELAKKRDAIRVR